MPDGSSGSLSKVNLSALYSGYTVAYSATPVFDLVNGITQTITLTGNVTSSTIVATGITIPTGARLVIRVIQDGTGARTFVWPTTITQTGGTTPIIISAVAADVTRVELQYNGSTWDFIGLPTISNHVAGDILIASGSLTAPDGSTRARVRFPLVYGWTGMSLTIGSGGPLQQPTAEKGLDLRLWASDAVAGSSVVGAEKGGNVYINAGDAKRLTSGDANGGDIYLTSGGPIPVSGGAGIPGNITAPHGKLGIGVASGVTPTYALTLNYGIDVPTAAIPAADGIGVVSPGAAYAAFVRTTNGTSTAQVGTENSAGGSIFTGATAHAGVIGTVSSRIFQFFTADTLAGAIDTSQRWTLGSGANGGFKLDVKLPTLAASEGIRVGSSAQTTGAYLRLTNATSTGAIGTENNAGGGIFTGSTANAFVLGSSSAHAVEIFQGDTKIVKIDTGQVLHIVSGAKLAIDTGGSTTISTGVGSVRMSTANPATNVVWVPFNYNGTTYYFPGWLTNSP